MLRDRRRGRHLRLRGRADHRATTAAAGIRETVREKYAAAARAAAERRAGAATPASTAAARRADVRRRRSTATRPRAPRAPRSMRHWAAASRRRSPTCTRARPCSTSAPAPAPTCSSAPGASVPTGKAIGLDMTDEMLELARANAAEAGVDERRVRQGLHRGHPAARRLRRRRDLQLRHQPRRRQAQGPRRGRAGPEARRPLRGLRRHRRRGHGRGHARGHGRLHRLHRRRADRGRVPRRAGRGRARPTSRSARPTACTRTPSRPSSAPASPRG